jgi:hypothetical protein
MLASRCLAMDYFNCGRFPHDHATEDNYRSCVQHVNETEAKMWTEYKIQIT